MAREVDLGSIIGPQGPQGEVGPTGAKGDKGDTGASGATWLSGAAAPTTQGGDGDFYINTVNFDVYKKASGAWAKTGNIKGATGAVGPKGDTGAAGPKGDTGAQGAVGPTGPQGPAGEAFAIAKTYASVVAMNAGYATDGVKQGQFVVIDTGNVEDADNAKLYLKGATAYTYITDLSGAQGMTGPQGAQGATGATGPKGDTGAQGPKGDAGVAGPKGDKGDTGATGAKGADGVTPSFEIRSGHLYAVYES